MEPHDCRSPSANGNVGDDATQPSTPTKLKSPRQLVASDQARRAFAGDPALIETVISKILDVPSEDLPLLRMALVGLAADRPLCFNTSEVLAAVPVRDVETKRQADGALNLNAVTDAGRRWSLRMQAEASKALFEALAAVVGSPGQPPRLAMAYDRSVAGRQ